MVSLQRAVRLMAVIPLTLAIAAGLPGQGGFPASTIGHAQHASSAAEGTRLRLKHNGRIAFLRTAWIETVNPDGTGVEKLTQACGYYLCSNDEYAWSPDGRRMALWKERRPIPPCSGRPCVTTVELSMVVINANGTGEKQLARCVQTVKPRQRTGCTNAYANAPSWSPDGTQVAFSLKDSLYIANANTGRLRRLTRCAASACFDIIPTWSADGARIAFLRNWSLFVVNANGSGLRRLPELGAVQDAAWSPDGRSIAFDSNDQIYTIHPDGSALEQLTRFSGAPGTGAGNPVWSPDGRRIAFFRTPLHAKVNTGELWAMNANGSHRTRLYSQPSYFAEPDNGPLWSPDGKHIVFDSNRPTKEIQTFYGISVIDANGGHLHVLENSGEEPAWQPVP